MPAPLDHLDIAADHPLLRLGRLLAGRGYRFTTLTPLSHQRVNARPGNAEARTLEDVFGWSRPFRQEVVGEEVFALLREACAVEARGELWSSRIRWSSLDGQLFVHSRYPTVDADAVFFGPDTYRFCQAIEAQLAARQAPVRRAVDIGCGAAPGALVLARHCPQAQVCAVDINPQALDFAAINAELAGVDLQLYEGSLLEPLAGEFDLIVSNPPYMLDVERRAYRHGGDALGADLSLAIVEAALPRLAPGGSLLLYTGVAMLKGGDPFWQQCRRQLNAERFSWHYRELDPDVFGEQLEEPGYASVERIAAVALSVTRR